MVEQLGEHVDRDARIGVPLGVGVPVGVRDSAALVEFTAAVQQQRPERGEPVGFTAAVPGRADTVTPYVSFETGILPAGTWLPTGLCLEADPGPDFVDRVATQRCDTARNAAQQWLPVNQGGGVYKFVNHAVGWCLYTGTRLDGSPIALWPCDANISNTRWAWGGILGFGHLESRIFGTTGHCLDVPNNQVLAGLWMQLSTCKPNPAPGQGFLMGEVAIP